MTAKTAKLCHKRWNHHQKPLQQVKYNNQPFQGPPPLKQNTNMAASKETHKLKRNKSLQKATKVVVITPTQRNSFADGRKTMAFFFMCILVLDLCVQDPCVYNCTKAVVGAPLTNKWCVLRNTCRGVGYNKRGHDGVTERGYIS